MVFKRQNKDWRERNGRKSLEPIIVEFLCENPTASKAEVIRGTGLSKPIIYKYYEVAKEKVQIKSAEPIVAVGLDTEKLRELFSNCENLQRMGRVERVNYRD